MGVWRWFYLLVEPLVEFLAHSEPGLPADGDPVPRHRQRHEGVHGVIRRVLSDSAQYGLGCAVGRPGSARNGQDVWLRALADISKVLLPASASFVLTGMRISLAIALIVTVIAEMVAGNSGIGFYVLNAQRSFLVPEMYAGVIALAFVGFGLNKIFVLVEHSLLRWQRGSQDVVI